MWIPRILAIVLLLLSNAIASWLGSPLVLKETYYFQNGVFEQIAIAISFWFMMFVHYASIGAIIYSFAITTLKDNTYVHRKNIFAQSLSHEMKNFFDGSDAFGLAVFALMLLYTFLTYEHVPKEAQYVPFIVVASSFIIAILVYKLLQKSLIDFGFCPIRDVEEIENK